MRDDDDYNKIKTDPNYILILNERIIIGRDIIDKLGPDYLLFLKYEELASQAEGMRLRSKGSKRNIKAQITCRG